MLVWILENTVLALTLAVLVGGITRVVKSRPAIAHAMWLAVLVVLLLPPMPSLLPICARDCLGGARVATQSWLASQHGEGDGTEVLRSGTSSADTFTGFDGELSVLLEDTDTIAASSLPITTTDTTSTAEHDGPQARACRHDGSSLPRRQGYADYARSKASIAAASAAVLLE